MSRRSTKLLRAVEDLLRLSSHLETAEARMVDAEAPLRAQSYEPSSASPRLYCMIHEGDLADCPEHDLCTGVPIDTVSDPAGEQAIQRATRENNGTAALRALDASIDAIALHAEHLYRDVAVWTGRAPTAKERRETDQANEVGCEICARSDKHVKALVRDATCNGALDRPHRLCRWHNDFVLLHGELPTPQEEARHQAGKKVTRAVREIDRLQRGLATGTYAHQS